MVEQSNTCWLDETYLLRVRVAQRCKFCITKTYHIAVILLDNYLAKITNVPKSILQAIGATTLFIASKLEEFQCK
jgi:hypothetical protein